LNSQEPNTRQEQLKAEVSEELALLNAGRYLQEAHASAVKIEGGQEMAPTAKRLVSAGIPVMGHIGILPQLIHSEGNYKVKGRSSTEASALKEDALALQEAGVFSIVLEGIHKDVSAEITALTKIPTIGIGAGAGCDGQIQVVNDILGLFDAFVPKHTHQYANLSPLILEAFQRYGDEIRGNQFPTDKQSFS